MTFTEEKLDSLFKTLTYCTLGVGGDGEGYIVSSDQYKALADRFERWENEHEKWFTTRHDYENEVAFSNNQEHVCFVRTMDKTGEFADIIIEVRWPIL